MHKISGAGKTPKEVPELRWQFVGKGGKFAVRLIILRLPDAVIFVLFAKFMDSFSALQICHIESPLAHLKGYTLKNQ